ncbi:MAG: insulinase family protein [Armatimonadetes bacterium]|nr:insulinase family protein [Armatimonadota bacterium]
MRRTGHGCYLFLGAALCVVLSAACYGAEVHSTVLRNGLSVVTCTQPASDVASVFVGFRVGAGIAQPVGIRALLHEHNRARVEQLLADDNSLAGLASHIRDVGSVRWRVEWDYLQMHAVCTSAHLEEMLGLVRAGLFAPDVQSDLLEQGRQRLKQEYDNLLDRPAEQAYYLFREAMLDEVAVAAAQPVFGKPEQVARITVQQASDFAHKYLQAANATVVVVSPLSGEQALRLVEDALGTVKRGMSASREDRSCYPDSRVRVGGSPQARLATVVVGVGLPAPGEPGFLVGQLLYHILGGPQGRLARDRSLFRTLALNLPFRLLAQRTPLTVLPVAMSNCPHLAIYAECAPNAVRNVDEQLLRHINSLGAGAIRPEELQQAKQRLINSRARTMLTAGRLAAHLGRMQMLGVALAGFADGTAQIQQLTLEDVTALAQTHFQNHYVGVQMPSSGGQH